MKNLNKNPQHVAQLGYNPFPMHQTVDRTDTVGYLTPCYYDLLRPGDKINAKVKIQSRTLPLLAPASASLHQCVDWFFVPLSQIVSQFGNWLDNVRDEKSDFYSNLTANNSPQNLPSLNPWDDCLLDYVQNLEQAILANSVLPTENQALAECSRLMDALHIPVATYLEEWNYTDGARHAAINFTNRINPFFPAAYQKIYFDYFRLSDREVNDPSYYNFDTMMAASNSPTGTNSIPTARAKKLFTIHRVPFRKDFFMNLFISPIQGQKDLSSYGVDLSKINQWLTSNSFYFRDSSGNNSLSNPTTIYEGYTGSPSSYSVQRLNTPVDVKSMFAIQKMLEISRRAGKHFDAQTLAHYGIDVPTGISGEVMHLGHHEQSFVIGDVISTANTGSSGSPLGEMAGKGYSSDMSSPVNFTAPYHGVLMAVYYVVPDAVYSQHGLDRVQMYISPQDWPRPELDSLGMQPLFGYQATQNPNLSPSDVLGWQYRYAELKQKANVAYGGVHSNGSLHYWCLTRHEITGNVLSQFLVPYDYLNDIMVPQFDYSINLGVSKTDTSTGNTYGEMQYNRIYDGDPFVNHFEFMVKKSSKMSTYGLLPL